MKFKTQILSFKNRLFSVFIKIGKELILDYQQMGGTCCTTGPIIQTQDQLQAHSAKCYLITCMDFRLIDDVVRFMDASGYNNNYDQFILAGASLGFTQQTFPHWGDTLMDHMGIGKDLHDFREIIIIDHLDCGAYRKFYPEIKNSHQEIAYHQKHLQTAYQNLSHKFPEMRFKGYIMNLEGECERMQIDMTKGHFLNTYETPKDKFLADIREDFND